MTTTAKSEGAFDVGSDVNAACERLYGQYHRYVFSILRGLLANRQDEIEDVAQDIWLRIYRDLGNNKMHTSIARPRAWVATITWNAVRALARKNKHDWQNVYLPVFADDSENENAPNRSEQWSLLFQSESPEDGPGLRLIQHEQLLQAFTRYHCSPQEQHILWLHIGYGYSARETARLLSIREQDIQHTMRNVAQRLGHSLSHSLSKADATHIRALWDAGTVTLAALAVQYGVDVGTIKALACPTCGAASQRRVRLLQKERKGAPAI